MTETFIKALCVMAGKKKKEIRFFINGYVDKQPVIYSCGEHRLVAKIHMRHPCVSICLILKEASWKRVCMT